jgi:hypothetical protein
VNGKVLDILIGALTMEEWEIGIKEKEVHRVLEKGGKDGKRDRHWSTTL